MDELTDMASVQLRVRDLKLSDFVQSGHKIQKKKLKIDLESYEFTSDLILILLLPSFISFLCVNFQLKAYMFPNQNKNGD